MDFSVAAALEIARRVEREKTDREIMFSLTANAESDAALFD
jgi:hypothetical protein